MARRRQRYRVCRGLVLRPPTTQQRSYRVTQSISVLDHGHLRLVESMGSDLSIVRNARVSYDAEWRAGEDDGKDAKLLNYLVKNHHTSPFESCVFTFDVKAPIFVFRQWHRHRTWSFNEISARYAELPEEFYVPDLEQITTQSASNKQMRTTERHPRAGEVRSLIGHASSAAFSVYKQLISEGCPRELACSVLPVGTYSHMFATVDLHNLMHFLRLRLHSAQSVRDSRLRRSHVETDRADCAYFCRSFS
ncbi:FAD-dependent thymidylate synthase [Polaromonas sp. P1(28)-13]|nr:FAD-dependent thymidylate synthase [Polaromonas sp. P1(28)-13]